MELRVPSTLAKPQLLSYVPAFADPKFDGRTMVYFYEKFKTQTRILKKSFFKKPKNQTNRQTETNKRKTNL